MESDPKGLVKATTCETWSGMESLRHGVAILHATGKYSDFVIQCRGKRWNVHKSIVCSQSAFFETACKPEWLATYDGVVQLQEESQEVAEAMIVFLYQNKYDDRSCLARMHFNLEVFIAADKFNIPGLAELARKKLMYSLDEMADFRDFLATIQTLYRQVPFHAPGIREKVVALAKATSLPPGNIQPDPAKTQAIDCLVNEVPNFGKELLVALAQHFWDLRSDIEQREALMEERDAFWNQRQLELTQEAAPLEQRIEELKQREETLSQEKQVLLERQGQSNRSSRKFKCLRCQSSFAMLNSTMDSRTLVCPYCKVRALVLR